MTVSTILSFVKPRRRQRHSGHFSSTRCNVCPLLRELAADRTLSLDVRTTLLSRILTRVWSTAEEREYLERLAAAFFEERDSPSLLAYLGATLAGRALVSNARATPSEILLTPIRKLLDAARGPALRGDQHLAPACLPSSTNVLEREIVTVFQAVAFT